MSDVLCTNCSSMDTGEPSPRSISSDVHRAHIRHSLYFCGFVDDPSRSNVFHIHARPFTGPSYKRGPPKGYINAIEQRMQHFEALLGVIMQTSDPRALNLIADLRQDELARSILNRVDAGRFVRRVRLSLDRPRAKLMTSQGPAGRGFHAHGEKSPRESTRSARRQSRVTREFVSNEGECYPRALLFGSLKPRRILSR